MLSYCHKWQNQNSGTDDHPLTWHRFLYRLLSIFWIACGYQHQKNTGEHKAPNFRRGHASFKMLSEFFSISKRLFTFICLGGRKPSVILIANLRFFINCDNGVMGLGSKHEGFSVVLTLERILQFPVFS